MKTHTTAGARILASSQSALLRLAEEIALTHHERWTGDGYPSALAGESIPLAGRIVAVADVFDALTHARPYKPAWPVDRALEEIAGQRGRQFDPDVVDGFLALDPEELLGPAPP
jgi:putative two-component system response regulator